MPLARCEQHRCERERAAIARLHLQRAPGAAAARCSRAKYSPAERFRHERSGPGDVERPAIRNQFKASAGRRAAIGDIARPAGRAGEPEHLATDVEIAQGRRNHPVPANRGASLMAATAERKGRKEHRSDRQRPAARGGQRRLAALRPSASLAALDAARSAQRRGVERSASADAKPTPAVCCGHHRSALARPADQPVAAERRRQQRQVTTNRQVAAERVGYHVPASGTPASAAEGTAPLADRIDEHVAAQRDRRALGVDRDPSALADPAGSDTTDRIAANTLRRKDALALGATQGEASASAVIRPDLDIAAGAIAATARSAAQIRAAKTICGHDERGSAVDDRRVARDQPHRAAAPRARAGIARAAGSLGDER